MKKWAYQILQGLVYLHGHTPPIIHRDLKCDNIFYNGSTGQLKIGDLGLATILTKSCAHFSVLGTPEFMAPELYNQQYDEKVDVYSFGMCLLEVATLQYPYNDCYNPMQIFKRVMEGQLPNELNLVKDEELRNFIRLCIQHDPKMRPHAKELVKHPIFVDLTNKPYFTSNLSQRELVTVNSTHSNLDKLSHNSSFDNIHQSGLVSRTSTPNLIAANNSNMKDLDVLSSEDIRQLDSSQSRLKVPSVGTNKAGTQGVSPATSSRMGSGTDQALQQWAQATDIENKWQNKEEQMVIETGSPFAQRQLSLNKDSEKKQRQTIDNSTIAKVGTDKVEKLKTIEVSKSKVLTELKRNSQDSNSSSEFGDPSGQYFQNGKGSKFISHSQPLLAKSNSLTIRGTEGNISSGGASNVDQSSHADSQKDELGTIKRCQSMHSRDIHKQRYEQRNRFLQMQPGGNSGLVAIKSSKTGLQLSFLMNSAQSQPLDTNIISQAMKQGQSELQTEKTEGHETSYVQEQLRSTRNSTEVRQNQINGAWHQMNSQQITFPVSGQSKRNLIQSNTNPSFKVKCEKQDNVLNCKIKFINPETGKWNSVSFNIDLNKDTIDEIEKELMQELEFSELDAQQIVSNIKEQIQMVDGMITDDGVVCFETVPLDNNTTQVDVQLNDKIVSQLARHIGHPSQDGHDQGVHIANLRHSQSQNTPFQSLIDSSNANPSYPNSLSNDNVSFSEVEQLIDEESFLSAGENSYVLEGDASLSHVLKRQIATGIGSNKIPKNKQMEDKAVPNKVPQNININQNKSDISKDNNFFVERNASEYFDFEQPFLSERNKSQNQFLGITKVQNFKNIEGEGNPVLLNDQRLEKSAKSDRIVRHISHSASDLSAFVHSHNIDNSGGFDTLTQSQKGINNGITQDLLDSTQNASDVKAAKSCNLQNSMVYKSLEKPKFFVVQTLDTNIVGSKT